MDPGYLKYLSNFGVDPTQYIEMQANYLRLLANYYTDQSEPEHILGPEEAPIAAHENVEKIEKIGKNEEIQEKVLEEPSRLKVIKVLHDEIPIRSKAVSFEKLLEEEMSKAQELEQGSNESKSKHNFLKRKSQNVVVNKEPKEKKAKKSSKKINFKRLQSEVEEVKEEKSEEVEIQNFDEIEEDDKKRESFGKNRADKYKVNFMTEARVEEEESPKTKQLFLKRGEGKLCTKVRSASSFKVKNELKHARNSINLEQDSKEFYSENEYRQEIPVERKPNKAYERYKKLAKDFEEKKAKLEKDALDFYKMRENEVKSLELWKQEEMKKITEEKKKLTKNMAENRSLEEAERLKKEVFSLKIAIQKSEEKHEKAINDLKDIIEALTYRNKELEKLCGKSESSISLPKSLSKPINLKEETPKFQKTDPPTFTFKLPDKKTIENKSKVPKPTLPLVEINLESPQKSIQETVEEGKTQKVFEDGKKEILFGNGVKKEIFPNGFVVVHFTNKDKKETAPDGKIVYHFFENKTIQTTFPDGLQLFQFHNGQTEKHFPDGTKEIRFPDGTVKCIFEDGEEESIFPDGTVQKVDISGVKYIEFVNGMKDTIMPDGSKIRVFPDGKVKKTGPNGKAVE